MQLLPFGARVKIRIGASPRSKIHEMEACVYLHVNSLLLKQIINWENHLLLFSSRKKKYSYVVPFLSYSGNVFLVTVYISDYSELLHREIEFTFYLDTSLTQKVLFHFSASSKIHYLVFIICRFSFPARLLWQKKYRQTQWFH